jgi:hypothetical protein
MTTAMWVLAVCGGLFVLGILVDAFRYSRAERRVLDLLQQRGAMTGLELVQAGAASRSHIYLVLSRLCEEKKVRRFQPPNGGREKYVRINNLFMKIKTE